MVKMRRIHLGLIPDGNRRWAKEHGMSLGEGYELGVKRAEECLRWCIDEGIEEVSVFAFSTLNLNERSKVEKEKIFSIFAKYFDKLSLDEYVHEHEIKVRILGRTAEFPDLILDAAHRAMEATRRYKKHFLNILMAYDGRDELLRCVGLASQSRGKVTQKLLERYLWVPRPVDLIIRTGGEHRLSNFMLYQSAYAEIVFLDKHWPDFTREDLRACLAEYERAERRMGA